MIRKYLENLFEESIFWFSASKLEQANNITYPAFHIMKNSFVVLKNPSVDQSYK